MLKIGLTGGIAAGKSVVSARLKELGAVVIDADRIARQAVEPGTPGLAAVVVEFGPGVLAPDGSLDRAGLAALVFADEAKRRVLNAVVHPLVRAEAARQLAAAPAGAIVVQDIPLLVETGQGAEFHLVVVVDAPVAVRVQRLTAQRGMTGSEALARIGAQAPDEDRLSAADAVIRNAGTVQSTLEQVDDLWANRLVPFARNLEAAAVARRHGPPRLVPSDPSWSGQAARLGERLQAAAPGLALRVDHIGSTAVPGLAAKDVIDLQVTVASLSGADAAAADLARAGFPRWPGDWRDDPRPCDPDPSHWLKRLHGNADPGRTANIHVRVEGSAGWRYALAFRDWLRAEPGALARYQDVKERVAAAHAGDEDTCGYAADKESWFRDVADPALQRWIAATGWQPPPPAHPAPAHPAPAHPAPGERPDKATFRAAKSP